MSRFRPVSRGKAIEPGEDFIDQMRSHLNDSVRKYDFIPCPNPKVDYGNLNEEQVCYYVYWRSELRKGNLLRSD